MNATPSAEGGQIRSSQKWYKFKEQRVLVLVGVLTLIFCVTELVFGTMVHSLALISDAFHMISDVLSLGVGFASIQLSRGAHSNNKTYGWARAEVLGGLTNGIFLIAVSIFICLEAIQRFFDPPDITSPEIIIYVAAAGLAVNITGMLLFASHRSMGGGHSHSHGHGHSHGGDKHKHKKNKDKKKGEVTEKVVEPKAEELEEEHSEDPEKQEAGGHKKGGNSNLHAIFLHMLGDALGSIGAMITGIFIRFSTWEHRFLADPVISILFSLIILRGSIPLVKRCINILMQSVPQDIELSEIRKALKRVDGVVSVHDLHVWQLSDTKHVATLHVNVEVQADFSRIAALIQKIFHKHGVHSTTVQPEYVTLSGSSEKPNVACSVVCQSLSCRKDTCCDTSNAAIIDPYD